MLTVDRVNISFVIIFFIDGVGGDVSLDGDSNQPGQSAAMTITLLRPPLL